MRLLPFHRRYIRCILCSCENAGGPPLGGSGGSGGGSGGGGCGGGSGAGPGSGARPSSFRILLAARRNIPLRRAIQGRELLRVRRGDGSLRNRTEAHYRAFACRDALNQGSYQRDATRLECLEFGDDGFHAGIHGDNIAWLQS